MTHDYATEAKIREACEAAGVLPVAIDDFFEDYRAHRFRKDEVVSHIETMRTEKPHRFVVVGTENNELLVTAFGPERNITAQGQVVKKFGAERARELAASFGTTLCGRPGTIPEPIKRTHSDRSSNPFTKLRRADGSVDPIVAAQVAKLTSALGTKKAEAIARAAGLTMTGLPRRT